MSRPGQARLRFVGGKATSKGERPRCGTTPRHAIERYDDCWNLEIQIVAAGFGSPCLVVLVAQPTAGGGNPMPGEEAAMTTLRRYLDALRIATAAFWRFARPPPDEPDIVEELLAGPPPSGHLSSIPASVFAKSISRRGRRRN